MRQSLRLVFAAAIVLTGVVVAAPSHAVDTVAYSWTVPCDDTDGVSTGDVRFIPGTYVVTATGGCTLDDGNVYSLGTPTTPCTLPVVGTVPCAGATIHNVPGGACFATLGVADRWGCSLSPSTVTTNAPCDNFTVRITMPTQVCLSTLPGAVGTVFVNTTTSMTAKFVDLPGFYSDNTGSFVITATRI